MNTSYLEMVASCNGWTSGILLNLCPNICLVPHYAWNGPIGLTILGSYSDMYTSPGSRVVYEHKLS